MAVFSSEEVGTGAILAQIRHDQSVVNLIQNQLNRNLRAAVIAI